MKLITNCPEYANDICDEIRLFIPTERIEVAPVCGDIGVCQESNPGECVVALLYADEQHFTAKASVRTAADANREYSSIHKTPYRGGSPLEEKRYAKRCVKVAVFRAMRQAYPNSVIPWGSLTGIRPTRLLRELIETEGIDEAERLMLEEFDVSHSKLQLAKTIVGIQQPFINSALQNQFDVYVGIPFCRTRCLYCSFASELRTKKTDMDAYLNALMSDITSCAGFMQRRGMSPRTFYMGGGTPTILSADELRRLLACMVNAYDVSGKEFTVEAGRPDTITREKLEVLREYGVTRVSVNPQTMCDKTLRLVGRDHTAADIIQCFETVREVGFKSINMDLIAGLPSETVDDIRYSLEQIQKLEPECLTVHTLAIKRSSRLHEHMSDYSLPSVQTVDAMTAVGANTAYEMGMLPYYMYRQKYMTGNLENVGYSKPESICVYNIDMMEDSLNIIAHGAGAMTKCVFAEGGRIERVPNPKDIATYIAKIDVVQNEREKLFEM